MQARQDPVGSVWIISGEEFAESGVSRALSLVEEAHWSSLAGLQTKWHSATVFSLSLDSKEAEDRPCPAFVPRFHESATYNHRRSLPFPH